VKSEERFLARTERLFQGHEQKPVTSRCPTTGAIGEREVRDKSIENKK
jgi:hypothetical protein